MRIGYVGSTCFLVLLLCAVGGLTDEVAPVSLDSALPNEEKETASFPIQDTEDRSSGHAESIAGVADDGIAAAQSSAQSAVQNPGSNSGGYFNPYGSAASSAHADAQANTGYPGQSPYGSKSQAQADAAATSQSGRGSPYYPTNVGHSAAHADAQALSGGGAGGFGPFSPGNSYPGSASQSHASASAVANSAVGSRLVPTSDIILPHNLPGHETIVSCSREGELHYYWSPLAECSVCVCIAELGYLRPICVSCGGCFRPEPPTPTPLPPPTPPPQPYTTPAPPVPEPQVSCDPLPTNEPFQNPLNPCQICICQNSYTPLGKPDVQIVCQENPQCVLPPDTTTLPPLPPTPVPHPLCDRFPQNVWFPHPNDVCKICECTVEVNIYTGQPEPHITCVPNPECEPPPPPFPITLPPYPVTVSPVTEVFPWPPVTPEPQPPVPPGPLPGPSPHESCRPFPPNIPFDHPWDSCRQCICSETFGAALTNVEVNCFTKRECCDTDSGYHPVIPVRPQPRPAVPVVTLDPICELRSFGVEFQHPADSCRVCSCDLYGYHVAPSCKRANRPDCFPRPPLIPNGQVIYLEPTCRYRLPYQEFASGCNLCVCTTVFNYVITKCTPLPNCVPGLPGPGAPGALRPVGSSAAHASANAESNAYRPPGNSYGYGAGRRQNSAHAAADAISEITNPQSYVPLGPNSPYGPSQTGSQSSAVAEANANQYQPGLLPNQYTPGSYPVGPQPNPYPYLPSPSRFYPEQSEASASASAEALSSGSQYQPGFPNPNFFSPGSQYNLPGQPSASAEAEALSSGSQYRPGSFPQYPQGSPGAGQSESAANAEAYSSTFQQNQQGYQNPSQSVASALSNAQSGLYQKSFTQLPSFYNNVVPGNANVNSAYPYPSLQYQPGGYGSASALANSAASGGESSAQALAASKASRIRSGASNRCQYEGDKYAEACTVCYCHVQGDGSLYAICYGTPCV